ncbi:hypothetical protein O181_044078 [Austropuccinia psidii MF-1]|uniref:Uncharacterized protein n=1 Tax=Austropuccinia psidii MF-1 TaxID=1389203 RepID=A0A9Q3DMN8_9BASI|nr:hypothetical protein [Austropuccinia psidii MF-1]
MYPKISSKASGNHQRPPASFQKAFALSQGKAFPSIMDPILQEPGMGDIWYYIPLCTIIHQKSSGDTFTPPLQHFTSCRRTISTFQREDLPYSSWQCMAESRRSFEDPNFLAVHLFVFHLRIFQEGTSKMVVKHQNSFKATSIPWKIQLFHTGCIQAICIAMILLGQFIFHSGNSTNIVQISQWPDLYSPSSFNTAKPKRDKSHKVPDFQVGELALVSTLNFNHIKGPKKRKDSYVVPFVIVALHGTNAVQVELSGELENKHPNFSVSFIKTYQQADKEFFPLRNPTTLNLPPVEQSEDRKIRKVIKERRHWGKNQR